MTILRPTARFRGSLFPFRSQTGLLQATVLFRTAVIFCEIFGHVTKLMGRRRPIVAIENRHTDAPRCTEARGQNATLALNRRQVQLRIA